jgi:MFS family permease
MLVVSCGVATMNDELLDKEETPPPSPAEDGELRSNPEFPSVPQECRATQIDSLPNGGLQAWLQVVGGFSIYFNTWGLIATYGVFQTYYETGTLFHASSSKIAWIGAVQACCTFLTGTLAGPIFDRGYLRLLLAFGSFFVIFGFMMVSLCHTLWQFILAQGFSIGIGSGTLFATVSPTISQYFDRHLGLANGVAASGSAIGGIIYPIAFYKLLPSTSFAWSVRILGFIALVTLLPPLFFMRRRIKPSKPRAFLDWTIFSDPPFLIYILGQLLTVICLYIILFYISFFSISTSITDAKLGFYIIPILNAGSLFGRIVPNILADRFGALNVMPATSFICAVLTFCMIAVSSTASLIILALLFGFFSGAFIALPGVALVLLTKDRSRVGTRIGMSLAFSGLGALAGGPGGGSVLQDYGKGLNFTALWVYGGVASAVAGTLFLAARRLHERGKKNGR